MWNRGRRSAASTCGRTPGGQTQEADGHQRRHGRLRHGPELGKLDRPRVAEREFETDVTNVGRLAVKTWPPVICRTRTSSVPVALAAPTSTSKRFSVPLAVRSKGKGMVGLPPGSRPYPNHRTPPLVSAVSAAVPPPAGIEKVAVSPWALATSDQLRTPPSVSAGSRNVLFELTDELPAETLKSSGSLKLSIRSAEAGAPKDAQQEDPSGSHHLAVTPSRDADARLDRVPLSTHPEGSGSRGRDVSKDRGRKTGTLSHLDSPSRRGDGPGP